MRRGPRRGGPNPYCPSARARAETRYIRRAIVLATGQKPLNLTVEGGMIASCDLARPMTRAEYDRLAEYGFYRPRVWIRSSPEPSLDGIREIVNVETLHKKLAETGDDPQSVMQRKYQKPSAEPSWRESGVIPTHDEEAAIQARQEEVRIHDKHEYDLLGSVS